MDFSLSVDNPGLDGIAAVMSALAKLPVGECFMLTKHESGMFLCTATSTKQADIPISLMASDNEAVEESSLGTAFSDDDDTLGSSIFASNFKRQGLKKEEKAAAPLDSDDELANAMEKAMKIAVACVHDDDNSTITASDLATSKGAPKKNKSAAEKSRPVSTKSKSVTEKLQPVTEKSESVTETAAKPATEKVKAATEKATKPATEKVKAATEKVKAATEKATTKPATEKQVSSIIRKPLPFDVSSIESTDDEVNKENTKNKTKKQTIARKKAPPRAAAPVTRRSARLKKETVPKKATTTTKKSPALVVIDDDDAEEDYNFSQQYDLEWDFKTNQK